MPDYAIHDGEKVINIIHCNSKELSEQLTGLYAIEIDNGVPAIGWTLINDKWYPPKLFPSWIWNGNNWEPPTPSPKSDIYSFTWNEQLLKWDKKEMPQPFKSWIKNENGVWSPPIPYPEDGSIYSWDENKQQWIEVDI